MYKKLFLVPAGAALFLASCGKKDGDFKTTPNGLEYKIVTDKKDGPNAKLGDMVEMGFVVSIDDSVLFNTWEKNNNQPVSFPVMPPNFKGDWLEGITLLSAGDSAIFRVPTDSVLKIAQGEVPAWMKKGRRISYKAKLVSIKAGAGTPQMPTANPEQAKMDDELLQNYFKEKNISGVQKTANGLYYTIQNSGSGPALTKGQRINMNYTGRTLDGNPFDSNVDPKFQHVEPFEFVLGAGQVIPGWDEGVAMLKKGAKATLYIPSTLAYGPQSPNPNIPANASLIFDVEVVDVK